MGGDGGSIPGRADLVRQKKTAEKIDPEVLLAIYWKLCALTERPLHPPIVACELGRLYNKEAVLELLLNRDEFPEDKRERTTHITSLKDVVTLNLTPSGEDDIIGACPVTHVHMNGHHKFVFLKSCGCVLSERCLREVPSDTCQRCSKPFTPADIIPINPPKEEAEQRRAAVLGKKKQEKLAKKAKKKEGKEAGAGAAAAAAAGPGGSHGASGRDSPSSGSKRKAEDQGARAAPALAPDVAAKLQEKMDAIKSNATLKALFADDKSKGGDRNFTSRTAFRQSFY